jgi:hypothetical protein
MADEQELPEGACPACQHVHQDDGSCVCGCKEMES